MTDLQPFIAIIVPILFNTAMIARLNSHMNQRFHDIESQFDARFPSLEARFESLTGKVAALTDRVTRLEERLAR